MINAWKIKIYNLIFENIKNAINIFSCHLPVTITLITHICQRKDIFPFDDYLPLILFSKKKD